MLGTAETGMPVTRRATPDGSTDRKPWVVEQTFV
jgi:hypothetical protein